MMFIKNPRKIAMLIQVIWYSKLLKFTITPICESSLNKFSCIFSCNKYNSKEIVPKNSKMIVIDFKYVRNNLYNKEKVSIKDKANGM